MTKGLQETTAKSIAKEVASVAEQAQARTAGELLSNFIKEKQYVGEVFALDYEKASVMVHDYARREVGGIPNLSFLVASRCTPGEQISWEDEWASVILLRVMGKASLPSDAEALAVRIESAKKATGEAEHWDSPENMDAHTAHLLSFAGVECRVIGTFFVEPTSENGEKLSIRFGSDISNYYPNQGLKVYKPSQEALQAIVNYRDPERVLNHVLAEHEVQVGRVRYASTSRKKQGVTSVPVTIAPADLLSQKTALFGMTRTGKSNTAKIILSSIFGLRFATGKGAGRVGVLVFDYNGEYANDNVQDEDGSKNPSSLKNIWVRPDGRGTKDDVVTYGIEGHKSDPDRKLLKINFFSPTTLQAGKEHIDNALQMRGGVNYLKNFAAVDFKLRPDASDKSGVCRYERRIFIYKGILQLAGFKTTGNPPSSKGLFNSTLVSRLKSFNPDADARSGDIRRAGRILSEGVSSWPDVGSVVEGLHAYAKTAAYKEFDQWYRGEDVPSVGKKRPSASGEQYLDKETENILGILDFAGGLKYLGDAKPYHAPSLDTDFATAIYNDLKSGRLVIVDQSAGSEELNRAAAERIMAEVFRGNMQDFRTAEDPQEILVFAEEAHNLLPSGESLDPANMNIWVRTAKEGAKLHIGFIYATQEVSSIHKNILKNTANWFIGHLNNTDETKDLKKFYDFADFEGSILRADDKGFIRVKTLSNKYVVPIQVDKFEVQGAVSK